MFSWSVIKLPFTHRSMKFQYKMRNAYFILLQKYIHVIYSKGIQFKRSTPVSELTEIHIVVQVIAKQPNVQ